ncbi:hypothetical protein AHF37_12139 [Paragonimus kellicotti]|nr:hypothetical protein AHF37_12139 [Paragonimus kellicotti]
MPKYCVQLVADVLTLPSRDTSEYSDINEDHPASVEKVVGLERAIICPLLNFNSQLTKSDGSIHNCAENYLELPHSANAHVFPMGNTACCMPDGIRQTWNNSAATDVTSSVQCFAPNLLPVHRTFVISRAVQCNDDQTNEPTMFNNHSYQEPNVMSCKPVCIRNNRFTTERPTAKTNVVSPFPEDEQYNKVLDDSTGGLNLTSNRISNLITSTSELSVDVSSLSVQKYSKVTSPMKSPIYGPTQSTDILQEHLHTSPMLQEEDIDSLSATMSVVSSKEGRESLKKFKQRPAPYTRRNKTSTLDERPKQIMHKTLQDWQTKPDNSASTRMERKVKVDSAINKNIQNSREKRFFNDKQNITCSDTKKVGKQVFSFGDINSDGTSDTLSDTSSVSSLEPSKLIHANKDEMDITRKKATTMHCEQKITVDGNCSSKYPTESYKTATLNQPNHILHQPEDMLSSLNKQMNPNSVTSVESSSKFVGKKTQVEEKNFKIGPELNDGSKQSDLFKKGDNIDKPCNLSHAPAFSTVRMTSKSRAFSESRLPTPLGRNFSPAYRPVVISQPVSPEEKLIVGREVEVSNNKDVSKNADEEHTLRNLPPNKMENKVKINSKNETFQNEIVQSISDSQIKQSPIDETKIFAGPPQCRRNKSKHHDEAVAKEKLKSQQPLATTITTCSTLSRPYHTERPPSCIPLSDISVKKTMKTLDNAERFCETQSTDLKSKSSGAAYNSSLDHTQSKSTKNTEFKNCHFQQSTGIQNNCSPKTTCSRSLLASPPARLPIRRRRSNESIVSAPLHSYSPCTQPRTKLLRRKFYIPESANIEAILSDPDDRRIKAICERYKCDVEIYSKLPWCGFLQYIVVLAARDSSTLRRCARTLDCRLNWCLNAQMR